MRASVPGWHVSDVQKQQQEDRRITKVVIRKVNCAHTRQTRITQTEARSEAPRVSPQSSFCGGKQGAFLGHKDGFWYGLLRGDGTPALGTAQVVLPGQGRKRAATRSSELRFRLSSKSLSRPCLQVWLVYVTLTWLMLDDDLLNHPWTLSALAR